MTENAAQSPRAALTRQAIPGVPYSAFSRDSSAAMRSFSISM